MKKTIKKLFSSKILPERINFYRNLLNSNKELYSSVFPTKQENATNFVKYLDLKGVSPNVAINSQLQADSINDSIFIPCNDLLQRGGKKWRPILGLILANYLKMPINDKTKAGLLYRLLYLTELLHNGSLIIDDVEDRSKVRRGDKCIHLIYGEDIAINAGISMLYLPLRNIVIDCPSDLKGRILDVYLEEMSAIHIGQGWDIEMKIKKRIPEPSNYKDTVLFKTGVFPRLIVKFLKVLFELERNESALFNDLINLADSLSIGFQIKDDLLNITECELAKNKGSIGEDITEGKLTLMVLHTMKTANDANKARLKEILQMRTENDELIQEALNIIKSNKSVEYAETIMNNEINSCFEICDKLKNNTNYNVDAVEDLISLLKYLIERTV